MTAKIVHYVIYDHLSCYAPCSDEIDVPLYWHLLDLRSRPYELTSSAQEVTCDACKVAFETEPQPATTADLLELAKILGHMMNQMYERSGADLKRNHEIRLELLKLQDKLRRPRVFGAGYGRRAEGELPPDLAK